MRSILSRLAREKGPRVRVMGVFKCGGAHFHRDCNVRKNIGKQSYGKGKQSKSWSKSEGKGKSKKRTRENPMENPKENSKGTKGAKGSHKGKTSKTGLSGLGNSTSEASSDTQESAQTCPTDISWNCDEWNDGRSSVGWHEGWEQTYDTSASLFSLGGLDFSAISSPKRFEWAKMMLDTGAAVNTFPLNLGPERAGDGRFCRTASGEWIPDGGAWQFQMRTDCSDICMEDSLVYTKYCAVLQRSRAKGDRISTSDMSVDT